jgi:hypothetical protein
MKNTIKVQDTRFPRLTRAILRRLDREQLAEVTQHGADTGRSGFTYYNETNAFYKAHKADILALAKERASDMGEEMLTMVQGFRCLGSKNAFGKHVSDYSLDEIAESLHSDKGDASTYIRNAMAWFALEEVARELNQDA